MSQARSHYELLGVRRTATTQEIRAAYLRLMKRYHPDAAQGAGDAVNLVPVLNRCYAVLRNPATRSQYDRYLEALARRPILPPRRRSVRRRSHRGWSLVVLASTLALTIWVMSLDPTLARSTQALAASAASWMLSSSTPAESPPSVALPDTSDARRMAELGRTLTTAQAERFSRACFAGSARQLRSGYPDTCVLFDAAFLYWRKMPVSSPLSPYFGDDFVDHRHREAMSAFGAAGAPRLLKLRQMAFLALMQNLEELRSTGDIAEPPPLAHAAQSTEMRDGQRNRLAEASP